MLVMFGQDVLLFEQSVFAGGANFHDRFRDMRLDVDNMSYEVNKHSNFCLRKNLQTWNKTPLYLQELLALGERIGNVNTGLSEEKILNCLRQWKYVSIASEPSEEAEPCCICRVSHFESLGFFSLVAGLRSHLHWTTGRIHRRGGAGQTWLRPRLPHGLHKAVVGD